MSDHLQAVANLPSDHGASALLYVVVVALVGAFLWIVRYTFTQVKPSLDALSASILALPAAMREAIGDAVRRGLEEHLRDCRSTRDPRDEPEQPKRAA